MKTKGGTLMAIGGHEDRTGDRVILRDLARRIGRGKLVVTTVASSEPDGVFDEYRRLFRDLGVGKVAELAIADRGEARDEQRQAVLDGASAVFFTGGDQLKITSQLGDTPIFRRVQAIYADGGIVAGTSAGASVVCETMLVEGAAEQSPRVGDNVRMAPGLSLIGGVVIDQHFAERGRMGRLLGAIAQNPRVLGLGVDENTAIVVEGDSFSVLGEGAVYVLDGAAISASNITEADQGRAMSIHDIRLHVLSQGDRFNLRERRPTRPSPTADEPTKETA